VFLVGTGREEFPCLHIFYQPEINNAYDLLYFPNKYNVSSLSKECILFCGNLCVSITHLTYFAQQLSCVHVLGFACSNHSDYIGCLFAFQSEYSVHIPLYWH
jgi:hypothetical protein